MALKHESLASSLATNVRFRLSASRARGHSPTGRRRRQRAFSYDKLGRQQHLGPFGRLTCYQLRHHVHRGGAHLEKRLSHGRKRRVVTGRERNVVEAHDRHIVRHAHAPRLHRADRSNRHLVIAGENRGRRPSQRQQLTGRLRSRRHGEIAIDKPVTCRLDSVGSKSLAVSSLAILGEHIARCSADVGDPAMTKAKKMRDGLFRGAERCRR